MPTLPALTVSQAHYDRIVAAFPGATLAEKAAAYEAWLVNSLIDEVERLEHNRIRSAAIEQVATEMRAVSASLPTRVPYPPGRASAPVPAAGGTVAARQTVK